MAIDFDRMRQSVANDGFYIADSVLSEPDCDHFISLVDSLEMTDSRRRGGIRDVFQRVPAFVGLARRREVRKIVTAILSKDAFAVRGIVFDKTVESNWLVPWHQDMTIAVQTKSDVEGFGPWSMKEGIHHVRPSVDVLRRMVTIRVHLDSTDGTTGALRVIPGSHHAGISDNRPSDTDPVTCTVNRGGVVVMKPLIWHASEKATRPTHRRVIHIKYADMELPTPLEWHERW